jgi:hypothetical protein
MSNLRVVAGNSIKAGQVHLPQTEMWNSGNVLTAGIRGVLQKTTVELNSELRMPENRCSRYCQPYVGRQNLLK